MEMDALRQQGQGPGRLGPPDELLDVVPAGKAQTSRQLSVDRVLHDHVQARIEARYRHRAKILEQQRLQSRIKSSFWSFFF